MKLLELMQAHKVATIALTLTLVAGVGVQVWIHYDKAQKAAENELAKQTYIEQLQKEETLKLEQKQAEREALIEEIENQPIVLPEKKEPKVAPKEETEPTEEPEEAENVVTEAKEIKKPELPEDAVTDDPEKHPEYKPEDNVIKDEPKTPQGGEKREDGSIYVPGFGWVEDSGEPNKGEVVDGGGDFSKQVGIMG